MTSSGLRFRERPFPQHISFFGNKKGEKPRSGSRLGQLIIETGGTPLITNKNSTGEPNDSLSIERTWDDLHPGPPYRSGGPLYNYKVTYPCARLSPEMCVKSGNKSYKGSFLLTPASGGPSYSQLIAMNPTPSGGFPDLSVYGDEAWARLKPKVEEANLFQFLVELREAPTMLKTSAEGFRDIYLGLQRELKLSTREVSNKVSSHFLNTTFGWTPFVSDVVKFCDIVLRQSEIIRERELRNNKPIRRFVSLGSSYTDELVNKVYGPLTEPGPGHSDMASLYNTVMIDGIPCQGFTEVRRVRKTSTWAKGSFTLYHPAFDTSLAYPHPGIKRVHQLIKLYGLEVSPVMIWRVMPWTWLLDWFVTLSKNIQLFQDWVTSEVVANYAYIMQTVEDDYIQRSISFFKQGSFCMELHKKVTYKQRVANASPYGFNLTWQNLSAKQLGILGALGVTRFPRIDTSVYTE